MRYESHELYHHGIKGQQWGVRRFQNEDGTLTEEGRQRYLVNPFKGLEIAEKALDKTYANMDKIREKYSDVDLNDDYNNLMYTTEIRDTFKKNYRDVLAKDIGTNPKTLDGQKWLDEMANYKVLDEQVEHLTKKVVSKIDWKGAKLNSKGQVEVDYYDDGPSNKASAPKEKAVSKEKSAAAKKQETSSKEKYAGKKMSQEQAINQAYEDLEKKYKDFNKLPISKQDELFFDYVNSSGLYRYM